jgi:hypothetical protein
LAVGAYHERWRQQLTQPGLRSEQADREDRSRSH